MINFNPSPQKKIKFYDSRDFSFTAALTCCIVGAQIFAE